MCTLLRFDVEYDYVTVKVEDLAHEAIAQPKMKTRLGKTQDSPSSAERRTSSRSMTAPLQWGQDSQSPTLIYTGGGSPYHAQG